MERNTVVVSFERTMEEVTDEVDRMCDYIISQTPDPVPVLDGLDGDSVQRAIDLLHASYPESFRFSYGKDPQGQYGLIAQFTGAE